MIAKIVDLEHFEMKAKHSGEALSIARSLSDFSGIESLLVHQEVLLPSRRASGAHFHSKKEEVFIVLSGTPSVWIEGEWFQLEAGQFVGFNTKEAKAHMLANKSAHPATVLTIGTNPVEDETTFVDL